MATYFHVIDPKMEYSDLSELITLLEHAIEDCSNAYGTKWFVRTKRTYRFEDGDVAACLVAENRQERYVQIDAHYFSVHEKPALRKKTKKGGIDDDAESIDLLG